MRRAITSVLLALFSFPLIAPVLLANVASDLPACCRRDGKHHCGMADPQESPSGHAVRATQSKCPLYPKASSVAGDSQTVLSSDAPRVGAPPLFRSSRRMASHDTTLVALRGSVQKRGPPHSLD
jgi:hypothetical protein